MEATSTDATPMLVLQPKTYGLKLSLSIRYNTMMETLSPLLAVLKQLPTVRPALGAVGMVDLRAWTLVPGEKNAKGGQKRAIFGRFS